MADKLTNKAEFIDAYTDWARSVGYSIGSEREALACSIWAFLVKRGLAEEQREPGWYWGKPYGDLCILEFDGKEWRSARGAVWGGTTDPCPIIRRIEEPKE